MLQPDAWAIIVAAGAGRRLGADVPKALARLAGKPLFMHSLEKFVAYQPPFGCVLAVPADALARFAAMLDAAGMRERVMLVAGGAHRSASVLAGLAALPANDDMPVLIHDAARPLASAALIGRVLDGVRRRGNATPAVPVSDTIKQAAGERLVRTLGRAELVTVQTPQGFRKGQLCRLLERFPGPHTDEAAALELAGLDAWYVPGERLNIKVTFPEDIRLAEAVVSMLGGR